MAIPELPVSRPIQVAENPKYVVTIGVIVTAETELGAAECVPAIVRSSIGVSSPLNRYFPRLRKAGGRTLPVHEWVRPGQRPPRSGHDCGSQKMPGSIASHADWSSSKASCLIPFACILRKRGKDFSHEPRRPNRCP